MASSVTILDDDTILQQSCCKAWMSHEFDMWRLRTEGSLIHYILPFHKDWISRDTWCSRLICAVDRDCWGVDVGRGRCIQAVQRYKHRIRLTNVEFDVGAARITHAQAFLLPYSRHPHSRITVEPPRLRTSANIRQRLGDICSMVCQKALIGIAGASLALLNFGWRRVFKSKGKPASSGPGQATVTSMSSSAIACSSIELYAVNPDGG